MISLTSPVDTAAHHLPAALKLSLLCAATVLLFHVQSVWVQLVFAVTTLTLYALPGRVFWRGGLGRLWVLWPFVALILVWHLVTSDLVDGLRIVLRMVTAVALANLVTMTTRLTDMMAVVNLLLAPLRRCGWPTRAVEVAMALVIRFTPVLAEKGKVLTLSWRARSARRPGWRILLPFADTALDDAEHVAEALKARGGL